MRLFVYGTLMRSHPMHRLVAARVESVRPAWTPGRLYHLPEGYPALVDAGDAPVHGELLDLAGDEAGLLREVDAYEGHDPDDPEGSLYLRHRRRVFVEGGTPALAWCYVMRPEAEPALVRRGARHLPDGRWPG